MIFSLILGSRKKNYIYPIELILKILFFRLDDEVNNLNYVEDSHYEFQIPHKVKL